MINVQNGTPFIGYATLTNAVPGPTAFGLNVVRKAATAYVLAANERIVITNITISSNDTAVPLVTVDDGGTTPQTLQKVYVGSTQPPAALTYTPGTLICLAGVAPRASAPAVTAAKTVELVIVGYITQIG